MSGNVIMNVRGIMSVRGIMNASTTAVATVSTNVNGVSVNVPTTDVIVTGGLYHVVATVHHQYNVEDVLQLIEGIEIAVGGVVLSVVVIRVLSLKANLNLNQSRVARLHLVPNQVHLRLSLIAVLNQRAIHLLNLEVEVEVTVNLVVVVVVVPIARAAVHHLVEVEAKVKAAVEVEARVTVQKEKIRLHKCKKSTYLVVNKFSGTYPIGLSWIAYDSYIYSIFAVLFSCFKMHLRHSIEHRGRLVT